MVRLRSATPLQCIILFHFLLRREVGNALCFLANVRQDAEQIRVEDEPGKRLHMLAIEVQETLTQLICGQACN